MREIRRGIKGGCCSRSPRVLLNRGCGQEAEDVAGDGRPSGVGCRATSSPPHGLPLSPGTVASLRRPEQQGSSRRRRDGEGEGRRDGTATAAAERASSARERETAGESGSNEVPVTQRSYWEG